MKKTTSIIISLLFLLIPALVLCQQAHTVGPKETIYSIGRTYNVHPRELAEYNKLDIGSGLTIGQIIKIPINKKLAPLDNAIKEKKSNLVKNPIFHTVEKKENLFQIKMKYNKVSIDSLKKWNNLTSDAVNEGMQLIVGYSYIESDQVSRTITSETSSPVLSTNQSDVEKKGEARAEKKSSDKKKKESSANSSISETAEIERPDENGYFRTSFEKQMKNKQTTEEKGRIRIFKSTSGWNDGKYYCLHNHASAGTIVKIFNQTNNRFIYAKVLDVIPDIEMNREMVLLLSNAGADKLGVSDITFEGVLNY